MPKPSELFPRCPPTFLPSPALFPSWALKSPSGKIPKASGPSTCLLLPFHNRLRFFLDQRFFTVHSLTEGQLDQLQAAWFRELSLPLSWRFYYLGPKPCLQELASNEVCAQDAGEGRGEKREKGE